MHKGLWSHQPLTDSVAKVQVWIGIYRKAYQYDHTVTELNMRSTIPQTEAGLIRSDRATKRAM